MHPPFSKIPLENVVLDELHLMLHFTDRLEEGLTLDILKWDAVSKKINSSARRAPWVRKNGNPSIREILVEASRMAPGRVHLRPTVGVHRRR